MHDGSQMRVVYMCMLCCKNKPTVTPTSFMQYQSPPTADSLMKNTSSCVAMITDVKVVPNQTVIAVNTMQISTSGHRMLISVKSSCARD